MKNKKIPILIAISVFCMSFLVYTAGSDSKSNYMESTGNNIPIFLVLNSEIQKGAELQKIYYSLDKNDILLGGKTKEDLDIDDQSKDKGNAVLKKGLQKKFPNLKINGKESSYSLSGKAFMVFGHSEGIIVVEDNNIETARNIDFIHQYKDSNSFSPLMMFLNQTGIPEILVHYYRPLEDGT